jgi:hypothetical protein
MTRDEAIWLARLRTGEADPVEFIDLCVELGMLHVSPNIPDPVAAKLQNVLYAITPTATPSDLYFWLENSGLRIVEK